MDSIMLIQTAKHWNSVQNILSLNFAHDFISSEKLFKAFKKIFSQTIQQSYDLFKRHPINLIVFLSTFPKQES